MGLDLYHYTLTEKYETSYDHYFYLEDLEKFPLIVKSNEHLITDVFEPSKYIEIWIFENEHDLARYEKSKETTNKRMSDIESAIVSDIETEIIPIHATPSLDIRIKKIEQQYSLDPDDSHTFDSERTFYHQGIAIPYTERSYVMTYARKKVIYHRELGHQRKGVNSAFYDAFENETIYISIEDVIQAFSHLEKDIPEYDKPRRENFQQNFIDNFVEGHSIFFASW